MSRRRAHVNRPCPVPSDLFGVAGDATELASGIAMTGHDLARAGDRAAAIQELIFSLRARDDSSPELDYHAKTRRNSTRISGANASATVVSGP